MGKSLFEILDSKTEGKSLVNDLVKIRNKTEPLLSKIAETFPEYTEHGIKHSERVIDLLGRIFSEQLKEELNQYELFFLIASAYLHDVGMVNFPRLLEGLDPKIIEAEKIADYIRDNHHVRSEAFLCGNFRDLAIDDAHQADIIGRICRGHRKENLSDSRLFESDRIYRGVSINLPLLSALLRLGDALDLAFERTPIIVYEHLPIRNSISLEEWKKHLSVSGVALHPEDPLIIKASAKCSSPKIHRILKRLETEINNELDILPQYLHQYRKHTKDLPRRLVISIETKDYKAYDFKFSLQEREITKLLMGEKLYKGKEESIRELLKNSVDACRARKELLRKQGLDYAPTVVFEQPSLHKLIVRDNGIGMDEDVIERYFTKIGRSLYTSPEFSENFEFTPVSELGIGFLSCFMIADKILIETKTDSTNSLLLEIEDISDFFTVQEGKLQETGTTVTLFLKKDFSLSLENLVRLYARHVEFSIEVKTFDTLSEIKVSRPGFRFELGTLSPTKIFNFGRNYDFQINRIDLPNVEGIVCTLFEKNSKLGLLPIHRSSLDWSLSERHNSFVASQKNFCLSTEGIFVGNINVLPKWLKKPWIFFDLNVKKRALDLNVARNDIVNNEKLTRLVKLIETMLIQQYRQFLTVLRKNARGINSNFANLSRTFFSTYFQSNYFKRPGSPEVGDVPTELVELLREFCYFKCVSKEGFEYATASDIAKKGKQVLLLQGMHQYTNQHVEQIVLGCSGFGSNHIYLLADSDFDDIANLLLGPLPMRDFMDFIKVTSSNDLYGLVPVSWKVVTFDNYATSRIMEISHYSLTMLNRNHIFLDLLAKNKDIIKKDKKAVLLTFFRSLKISSKGHFLNLQTKQRDILTWFVEEGVLKQTEIDHYVLKTDDFPPHVLMW